MASSRELPVQAGDLIADKYRVGRVLGVGGMGAVLMATHVALDQPVAIKIIRPHAAGRDDAAERFRREARVASRLKSDHIARVIDFGTFGDGVLYQVMELLDGRDLAAEIRAAAPLRIEEACEIGVQACEALSCAHAEGIVHRDIKPANLFLTRHPDGSPCVKVLDFGIAKLLHDEDALGGDALTQTGAMIGSPVYMSLEQLRSPKKVDGRSDIWSLGAALYEALTGVRPFTADHIGELIIRILEEPPVAPRELRPEIPEELSQAILRAMERKIPERFQTAGQLAQALAVFAPRRCHHLLDRMSGGAVRSDDILQSRDAFPPRASGAGAPISQNTPSQSGASLGGEPQLLVGTTDGWTETGQKARPVRSGRRYWVALAMLLAFGAGAWLFASRLSGLEGGSPATGAAGPTTALSSPAPVVTASPPASGTAQTVSEIPSAAATATATAAASAAAASPTTSGTSKPAAPKKSWRPPSGTGVNAIPDYGGRK